MRSNTPFRTRSLEPPTHIWMDRVSYLLLLLLLLGCAADTPPQTGGVAKGRLAALAPGTLVLDEEHAELSEDSKQNLVALSGREALSKRVGRPGSSPSARDKIGRPVAVPSASNITAAWILKICTPWRELVLSYNASCSQSPNQSAGNDKPLLLDSMPLPEHLQNSRFAGFSQVELRRSLRDSGATAAGLANA